MTSPAKPPHTVSAVRVQTFDCRSPLADRQRLEAAHLIYESVVEYYGLFSPRREVVIEILCKQFTAPFSETSAGVAAFLNEELASICTSYPSEEMQQRQMASLHDLLMHASLPAETLGDVKRHRSGVEVLQVGSLYISRVATSEAYRGRGLARVVIQSVEELARVSGVRALSTHVRRDNASSMRLFQAAGFCRWSAIPYRHVVLWKEL